MILSFLLAVYHSSKPLLVTPSSVSELEAKENSWHPTAMLQYTVFKIPSFARNTRGTKKLY